MIKNKVVVITGASSGIGAATAELLAERGAKVVLGARRKDRLDALAQRLGAISLPTDVRRAGDVAALVRVARETHGRLDVLVGNAGVGPISPLDSLRVDDWDAMIDVNVKGVLHGIAAALPVFREQGSGQFVHTASTAAYRTVPTMAVYAATKTAVRTISEGLRQEAGPNLRVSLVSPGFIATDFIDGIPEQEVRAQLGETRDAVAIPPEAIARAIAFAIEQPADVDVNEIVVRPTAQA
ncbi:SDR family oxidoreductase [Amycolatopsis sp. A133]|uniref:SDR family oxidoreductase n=1 Tax=Amycolatopsis sp. A133 TaxID=3064472 RepID=UPI0027F0578D|nr:SDR family oxidoreductase [Amycolatopsis sp. A133]MDQ7808454.1 SDR family oxidoreductase [Amycolatopsis sp. A133]